MPARSSHQIDEITVTEYTLLRSYALGMGEDELLKLTGLSRISLFHKRQSLFEKFEVNNVYFLILRAKQYGVLDAQSYLDESLKTSIHNFILANEKEFKPDQSLTQEERWKWYRLLLLFLSTLEQQRGEGIKKIPPKRDRDF